MTLQDLIREKRKQGGYSPAITDTQIAGIILAQWASYDGFTLFKACAAAAEDANFHEEAAKIRKELGE